MQAGEKDEKMPLRNRSKMEFLPLNKPHDCHKGPDQDCSAWRRGLGEISFWPSSKDGGLIRERDSDFSHRQIVTEQGVTISN